MLSTHFTNKKISPFENDRQQEITDATNDKHQKEHNKMEKLMNSRHYTSKFMLSDKKDKKKLSTIVEKSNQSEHSANKTTNKNKDKDKKTTVINQDKIRESIKESVKKTIKEESFKHSLKHSVKNPLKGGSDNKSIFKPLSKIKQDDKIRTPYMPLEKEKHEIVKPIVESCERNYHKPQKGIIIEYDEKDQEFSFFTPSFSLIGSFTTDQLLKYLVDPIDSDNRFLSDIKYQKAKDIIKRFVGSPGPTKGKLTLLDANSSPLMSNVEMLIRLNNNLHEFEKRTLPKIIPIIDRSYAPEIKGVINKFIFYMLNHTMKMISIGSSRGGGVSKGMKENLSNYSVGTVYRISQYVNSELTKNVGIQQKLIEQLKNIESVKNKLNHKMENITKLLEEQNQYLQTIASSGNGNSTQGYTQTAGGEDPTITTNLTDSSDQYSLTGTMHVSDD